MFSYSRRDSPGARPCPGSPGPRPWMAIAAPRQLQRQRGSTSPSGKRPNTCKCRDKRQIIKLLFKLSHWCNGFKRILCSQGWGIFHKDNEDYDNNKCTKLHKAA